MSEIARKFNELTAISGGKDELDKLRNRIEKLEQHGGGAGGGGMEARIARLEASITYIEKTLTDTRTDVKDVRDRTIRLEEKVNHLPSKGFIVSVVLTAITFLTAIIVLQDKISTWVGS